MSKLEDMFKVNLTLGQVKEYVDGKKEKGCVVYHTSTPRQQNGYEEDVILKASFYMIDKNVSFKSKIKHYTGLTLDNYLIHTTYIVDDIGCENKSEVFGTCYQELYMELGNIFKVLPEDLQNEVVALEWLAHNPTTLGQKVDQVLKMSSMCLESKDKDIHVAEEMLVNAHYNMKKNPKEVFTKAWKGKHFEKVLKVMPWFKSCLDKEENTK